MRKEFLIPLLIQTVIWFGAAWSYASALEHRFTVLEETLKIQVRITDKLTDQMETAQKQQQRLLTLEEWWIKNRLK